MWKKVVIFLILFILTSCAPNTPAKRTYHGFMEGACIGGLDITCLLDIPFEAYDTAHTIRNVTGLNDYLINKNAEKVDRARKAILSICLKLLDANNASGTFKKTTQVKEAEITCNYMFYSSGVKMLRAEVYNKEGELITSYMWNLTAYDFNK